MAPAVQLPRSLSQDFTAVAAAPSAKQSSHSVLVAAWGEANTGLVRWIRAPITTSAPVSASCLPVDALALVDRFGLMHSLGKSIPFQLTR